MVTIHYLLQFQVDDANTLDKDSDIVMERLLDEELADIRISSSDVSCDFASGVVDVSIVVSASSYAEGLEVAKTCMADVLWDASSQGQFWSQTQPCPWVLLAELVTLV